MFLVFVIVFSVGSMLLYGNYSAAAFAYFVAGMNIVSVLFFIRGNEDLLIRAAKNVFWLSLFVGALQFFVGLSAIEEIVRILIQRFYGGQIGGYRGVTMLETEPARASLKILLLYIVIYHKPNAPLGWILVLMLVVQVAMIKSATGIFLSLLLAAILGARYSVRYFYLFIPVLAAALWNIEIVLENPKVAIIYSLYETHGFVGIYNGFAATSGGRFLAIVQSVTDIVTNPFGHGLDRKNFGELGAESQIVEQLVSGYQTQISTKPTSVILNFAYVFGVVPVIVMLATIARFIPRGTIKSAQDPITWIFVFCGLFYSAPATPTLLIAWALYRYRISQTLDSQPQGQEDQRGQDKQVTQMRPNQAV
ncbi:MAG: hypothetical protein ACPGRD_00065 [Planktomarina sp.]